MQENFIPAKKISPYLKRGFIAFATLLAFSIGFLIIKVPTFAKNTIRASLEKRFDSLGIQNIHIDDIRFGWRRVYIQDIHTATPSSPINLTIQEMNIAVSTFLKPKAIDIVGATLEFKGYGDTAIFKEDWQEKGIHLAKTISQLKRMELPMLALRDGLVIIPTSHGSLKVPVHAVTETTVTGKKIFTVDWGEHESHQFYGQLVLEGGLKESKIDIHSANIDVKSPSFQIKAPEISLWLSHTSEEDESCKVEGFAKIAHFAADSYGMLKTPLDINLEGSGTPENLLLDTLTVSPHGSETNFLEVEGTLQLGKASAALLVTSSIPHLSQLWDFTPLLGPHKSEKLYVDGNLRLEGKILWEEGTLKTSPLTFKVKDMDILHDTVSINGITSTFTLDNLMPLTTKGPQRLSATSLSFGGMGIKNILLEGTLDEKGLWQTHEMTAEILGGELRAHHFQRVGNGYALEADFNGLELGDILQLAALNNLSGYAKLAGNASLRYSPDRGLDILQAELHSTSETGLIQYTPETFSSFENQKDVHMAFHVLENLNFTLFTARLEQTPETAPQLQAIVKVLGANPKVLNGYPFEFNIVTTGKLKELVANTIQRMRPVENLKDLKTRLNPSPITPLPSNTDVIKPKELKKKIKASKISKPFKKKSRKLKNA